MCLVEVEKAPKCIASCAWPVMPNMAIYTNTPVVKKAREAVMEFLLANHPLDCPICDQGGECDLQDQAMTHGSDSSRFFEFKRGVEDKDVGPLVKMIMTRCIHCTRCVRFAEEIAGVQDLGMTGRGGTVEIGTYVEKLMSSELSGNVIDLCPVGALTSKPYAMTARPWELRDTETIDVHDAIGSNIVVRSRGTDIMKMEPKRNPYVNEEWLSDKSRFSYDGLVRQRLDSPMVKENGSFVKVSWEEALEKVSAAMGAAKKPKAMAGDLCDVESMMALKDLMNKAGCDNLECRQDGADLSADIRGGYLFNTTLEGAETSDCVLLVGCNPRHEAPLLNTRIRKAVIRNDIEVGYIGPAVDLTYGIEHLGHGTATLEALAAGKHPFCELLAAAERPMIVVGMAGLQRSDAAAVKSSVATLAQNVPNLVTEGWNGVNTLHLAASRAGALEIGFVPSGDLAESVPSDFVYLLGADEFDEAAIPADAFVVYQGSHGDAGAHRADVILPGAAYTEKHGTYVNTEGRVQRAKKVKSPVGDAREDWAIVRALSEVAGKALPYDSLDGVRARMAEVSPSLVEEGVVPRTKSLTKMYLGEAAAAGGKMDFSPFARTVDNFYMTNPINRASSVMAKCTATKRPSYAYVGGGVTKAGIGEQFETTLAKDRSKA